MAAVTFFSTPLDLVAIQADIASAVSAMTVAGFDINPTYTLCLPFWSDLHFQINSKIDRTQVYDSTNTGLLMLELKNTINDPKLLVTKIVGVTSPDFQLYYTVNSKNYLTLGFNLSTVPYRQSIGTVYCKTKTTLYPLSIPFKVV